MPKEGSFSRASMAGMAYFCPKNSNFCPKNIMLFCSQKVNQDLIGKVLYLLEACFHLISSLSPSIKIKIMGGKITDNLGFESLLGNFCPFSVHFQILHQKLLIFVYPFFDFLFYKSDINRMFYYISR